MGELGAAGEFAVLTDSLRGHEVFGGSKLLYSRGAAEESGTAGPLAVGGWFSGEEVVPGTEHFLVRDLGLWPGGMGPRMVGGMTLIRTIPNAFRGLWRTHLDRMKSESFRGLFSVDVVVDQETGMVEAGQLSAGWDFLHTHAFVSDLGNLGELLEGSRGHLMSEYVVALPVTMPPFPCLGNVNAAEVKVEGLDPGDHASIFFHDFYTKGDHEVWTAGLDGLVAVVRGSGQNFLAAQQQAVEKAGKMWLPEKQWRPDVGREVPGVLAMLERGGYA